MAARPRAADPAWISRVKALTRSCSIGNGGGESAVGGKLGGDGGNDDRQPEEASSNGTAGSVGGIGCRVVERHGTKRAYGCEEPQRRGHDTTTNESVSEERHAGFPT